MDSQSKATESNANRHDHKKYLLANIFSAVFYGLCSTSMAFINKAVISSYKFDFPYFIMACQMTLTIGTLELLRAFQYLILPKYTIAYGITLLWASLFYAAHSITALYALGGMSIPMYAAIKRCSPIVTLITSILLLRKTLPSINTVIAVFLITFGCILAGIGDLQFDVSAYTFGTVSVLVQGLYLTLVQKGAENASALQILHVNSYNTLPIYVILTIFHDVRGVADFKSLTDMGFLSCFFLQVVVGVLLNFSLFMCTANNSALTTSLIGVMKSMLQTVIGSFTFGGVDFTVLNVVGIILNSFGGMLYVLMKYREKSDSIMKSPVVHKLV